MFLDEFHSAQDGRIQVGAEQASRFAKEVADDFNPIHDADSKRFCVPGDLLFSLVLGQYGLSQRMCFIFKGMVGDSTPLLFPPTDDAAFNIDDETGKTYLSVERDGEISTDAEAIESLTKSYVAFSGRNFPHVLVPLMASEGVMINPDRPLVIYERMSFQLDHLNIANPRLDAAGSELTVKGKRGEALLHFNILSDGKIVGKGFKKLLLSGLKPYESAAMDELSATYLGWKNRYREARS